MCGRYYIDSDDPELARVASDLEVEMRNRGLVNFKTHGEIFPSDKVPVQTEPGSFQPMQWGFKGYDKRPLINARSETALEKPLFRDAMRYRRCLIPASGYYEWQSLGKQKIRYEFFLPQGSLFMAGCYRLEKDNPLPVFVILTRQATPAFAAIHDRMPVIIPSGLKEAWLRDSADAMQTPLTDLIFQKSTAI